LTEFELEILLQGGGYYEGLRWRDDRWWVTDFQRKGVYTVAPDGEENLVVKVEAQPSGLGWLPDGTLLVVSMKDHRLLRRLDDGTIEEYADLSALCRGHANDMVVSSDGYAYVGMFGFDIDSHARPAKTHLVCVRPDRSCFATGEDLFFPNGMVITPDGKTLVVGESLGGRYTAFDIRPDGTLSDRRLWAEMGPMPVLGDFDETIAQVTAAPDGCGLDAGGGIWSADTMNRRCVRIVEGGEITDEIPAPEGLYWWACMLGGADGRTLLLSCAPGYLDHGDGDALLYTTTVQVPHAGLP
jgi:sugar lactone lactonase YvrE